MGIFKKKPKTGAVATTPPVEAETPAEIDYTEQMDVPNLPEVPQAPVQPTITPEVPQYQQVPVCLSQAQINNLVIENNIMLKQIIAEIEED